MMNSKERAALKAQANALPVLFQVGKGGVSPALIQQTLEAFNTRELVKLKALLESIPDSPQVMAERIASGCDAEVVQVIGGSIILYKENPELRETQKKKKSTDANARVGIRARKLKAAADKKKKHRTPYDARKSGQPTGKRHRP